MGDLANLTRWEPFADGSADTLNSDILVSISSLVVTIAVLYLTPDGASCTACYAKFNTWQNFESTTSWGALSNTIPAAIVSALAHSSLAVSVGSQDGSGTGDYTVVSPYWYMGSAILYSFMGGYFAYVWIPDTYVLCGSKKFKTATKLATAWSMLCLLLGVVATLFAPDIRFQFVSILIGGALSTLTRLFVYCKRLGVPSDEDHSTRGCGRAVVHPLRAVGYILVAIAGLCGLAQASLVSNPNTSVNALLVGWLFLELLVRMFAKCCGNEQPNDIPTLAGEHDADFDMSLDHQAGRRPPKRPKRDSNMYSERDSVAMRDSGAGYQFEASSSGEPPLYEDEMAADVGEAPMYYDDDDLGFDSLGSPGVGIDFTTVNDDDLDDLL